MLLGVSAQCLRGIGEAIIPQRRTRSLFSQGKETVNSSGRKRNIKTLSLASLTVVDRCIIYRLVAGKYHWAIAIALKKIERRTTAVCQSSHVGNNNQNTNTRTISGQHFISLQIISPSLVSDRTHRELSYFSVPRCTHHNGTPRWRIKYQYLYHTYTIMWPAWEKCAFIRGLK